MQRRWSGYSTSWALHIRCFSPVPRASMLCSHINSEGWTFGLMVGTYVVYFKHTGKQNSTYPRLTTRYTALGACGEYPTQSTPKRTCTKYHLIGLTWTISSRMASSRSEEHTAELQSL